MKKRYLAIFIPMFILILMPRALANTYTQTQYTTDEQLYMPLNQYIDYSQLIVMLNKIKTDFPNWYTEFDYSINWSSSTQTRIRLIPKNDPRVRYFYARINLDTSPDIDQWYLFADVGTALHWSYSFTTSTGAYISRTSSSAALEIQSNNIIYYHNLPMKVQSGWYAGSTQVTALTDAGTTVQRRPLPSDILVNLGVITYDSSYIGDKVDESTTKSLNFFQQVHYNWLSFVFGNTTKADEYKNAILNGNMDPSKDHVINDIKDAVSGVFSLPDATFKYTRLLADTVVGITTFVYKLIETALLLVVDTISLLVSVSVKAATVLSSLNSKLNNTPTILIPVYQASFTIFPAIMGIGVVKFFFRLFRG